jgi:hypothetical protein
MLDPGRDFVKLTLQVARKLDLKAWKQREILHQGLWVQVVPIRSRNVATKGLLEGL